MARLPQYKDHTPQFGRKWHLRFTGPLEQILTRFRGQPNLRYLEIGVWEGLSMYWMHCNVLTDPSTKSYAIDPWLDAEGEQRYQRTLHNLSPWKEKIQILRGTSRQVLMSGRFQDQSFDIIYIDGDHIAPAALQDLVLTWGLLKDNGLMIFDDYMPYAENPKLLAPSLGADAFLNLYRGHFIIPMTPKVSGQLYLIKTGTTPSLG